jgi:hypothetical protein
MKGVVAGPFFMPVITPTTHLMQNVLAGHCHGRALLYLDELLCVSHGRSTLYIKNVPILIALLGLRIFLLFITLYSSLLFLWLSCQCVMCAQDNESKDTNAVGL